MKRILHQLVFVNQGNSRQGLLYAVKLIPAVVVLILCGCVNFYYPKNPQVCTSIMAAAWSLSLITVVIEAQSKINVNLLYLTSMTAVQGFFKQTHMTEFDDRFLEYLLVLIFVTCFCVEMGLFYARVRDRRNQREQPDQQRQPFDAVDVIDSFYEDDYILKYYNVFASVMFGLPSVIPFKDAGLVSVTHEQAAFLLVLWICSLVVESIKNAHATSTMKFPDALFKCAPLIYMGPYYLPVACVFLVADLIIIAAAIKD